MTKSETARIGEKYLRLRKRLYEDGVADTMTDIDNIIAREAEKIFCKEKKEKLRGFF